MQIGSACSKYSLDAQKIRGKGINPIISNNWIIRKRMVTLQKGSFSFIIFVALGWLCQVIGHNIPATYSGIRLATLVQLIIFIVGFVILGKRNRNMLSAYNIFLLAFYFFQNGQVLLYSLGVDYNYFYVERYETTTLLNAILFSTMCLCAALAAGTCINPQKEFTNRFYASLNCIDVYRVMRIGKILWLPLAVISIPYMIVKLWVTSTSGYFAMMALVSRLPSIFNLLEKLFIGTSILLLVYAGRKTTVNKLFTGIFIIWSIMATLTGDRTVGLAGLVTVALLRFNLGYKTREKKTISKYFAFGIVAVVVMYLVSIAFSFRMQSVVTTSNLKSTIVDFIGTLGFSFLPLVLVMRIYPAEMAYMKGKSIVGGIVSGLIPSSLDVLHITNIFSEWNAEGTNIIDSYYRYGFGLDFSLNAECYINFGRFGWIAMFFLCCVVATLLRQVDYTRKDNLFSQYAVIVLLYSWFTLPRRKSYYIFNNFFWYIFIIGTVILIFNNWANRRGG